MVIRLLTVAVTSALLAGCVSVVGVYKALGGWGQQQDAANTPVAVTQR